MKSSGFTLIELVTVIVILGILSAVALPRFIDLSNDAKYQVLMQLKSSVKSANDLLFLKSKMPSYTTRPVPGRADLIDVDMDNDGLFDVSNNIDVRLKWGYLDNTDIIKRIEISNEFHIQYENINYTYVGYDKDGDGNVKEDSCYFKYTQAQNAITPPQYELVHSNC
ncbi:type II secretion system protein [Colwelliaceae bacterium 6471]